MSRCLVQARYTGPGPRQGVWLRASEQGFLSADDFHDVAHAKRELRRLKKHPRFFRKSDWELRVHPVGTPTPAAPEPKPKPPEPEPLEAPKPKRKAKKKKKPTEPIEPPEPEENLW